MNRILNDFADAAIYLLFRLVQVLAVVIGIGMFMAQLLGQV
jgi:hypothetical protein